MKSYRFSLFRNFAILFLSFTIVVILFQYSRELRYKEKSLISLLDIYSSTINNEISSIDPTYSHNDIESVTNLFPNRDLRITIIDLNGDILFDTDLNSDHFSNHIDREEIKRSNSNDYGTSIRFSESLSDEFFYYAKKYDNYYIRTALPYNRKTIQFLQVDDIFFFFMVGIFALMLIFTILLSGKMNRSISQLEEFANRAASDKSLPPLIKFEETELGEISNKIAQLYNDSRIANEALSQEKEKLYKHLMVSQSGLAVFTKDKKEVLSNQLFTMLVNLISDNTKPIERTEELLKIKELEPIVKFIDNTISGDKNLLDYSQEGLEIEKNGITVSVQAVIFNDLSFEIVVHDITKIEASKRLKQELTGNIAHELKTPVAAIKGYLETVINNSKVDKRQQERFLNKALSQTNRLTDLISDISKLTKIEEANSLYKRKELEINKIVTDVTLSLENKIDSNRSHISINIPFPSKINGNQLLLFPPLDT